MPDVSIIIVNYNYGRFVGEAIDSALAEATGSAEVIVVDDGSTDGSQALIAGYGRAITAVMGPRQGGAQAFWQGLAAARGEIVCLLDADDRFLAGKVALVKAQFAAYPEAGWVFHRMENDDAPAAGLLPEGWTDWRAALGRGEHLPYLPTATSSMAFRRSLLARLLPLPLPLLHDARGAIDDFYLKAGAMGLAPGVMDYRRLTWRRLHANNTYVSADPVALARRQGELRVATAMRLYVAVPAIRRAALRHLVGCWHHLRGERNQRVAAAFCASLPLQDAAYVWLGIRRARCGRWARRLGGRPVAGQQPIGIEREDAGPELP